jgi:putative ABC transport system permease protein
MILPGSTFRARVRPAGVDRVDMLIASASSAETVERAQRQIEQILRQRHGIVDPEPADFAVRTQAEFRRTQEGIYAILSGLLLSVAAVSLFVGGIGVMNIMLVSVTERTREIGIRMAIGAREGDILLQFLVEAVVLSLLGGLAGLALSYGLVQLLSGALGFELVIESRAVVIAVTTSCLLGVVFGFFPARRAARLDPIQALGRE